MSSENELLQQVHTLWCAAIDQLGEQQPSNDLPSENPISVDLLRRLLESAKTASYLKNPEFIQRIRQQRDINPPDMALSWDSIPALRQCSSFLRIRPIPSVIQPNDTAPVPATTPNGSLTDEERLAALVAYTVIIRACCRNAWVTENYEIPKFDPARTETYCRDRFLGSGNYRGSVYTVFNHPDRRVLAMKVCWTFDIGDITAVKNVLNEERQLRNSNHPNLVRFIASHLEELEFQVYMEYVPGGTIAGMAAALGPMREEETRAVVKQVLAGLVYLHGMKIVHRDIKGANLLITMDGCVKIADLGTAKPLLKHQDARSVAGTFPWMSPEVLRRLPYGAKTDVWSMGCVILEMHLGSNPWEDMSLYSMVTEISEAKWPPIDRILSKGLRALLEKVFVVEAERISSATMQMDMWVQGEAAH